MQPNATQYEMLTVIAINSEQAITPFTEAPLNVGALVEYRGVSLSFKATIIALDCDKWGNCMARLQPLDGSFPMWREVSRCKLVVMAVRS